MKNNCVKEIYVCDYLDCKLYLDQPIALPCGCTICKMHVDSCETHVIKCHECDESHEIPRGYGGFRVNRKLKQTIEKNLHLAGTQKETKIELDKFKSIVQSHLKSELFDPNTFLHEHFARLINKIDLHRDQMIEQIHKKSQDLIDQLKVLETDMRPNADKMKTLIDLNELDKKIDNWSLDLKRPYINDKQLQVISNEIAQQRKEFERKLKKMEKNILDNKNIQFEQFDNKMFGQINISKLDKLLENSSTSSNNTNYQCRLKSSNIINEIVLDDGPSSSPDSSDWSSFDTKSSDGDENDDDFYINPNRYGKSGRKSKKERKMHKKLKSSITIEDRRSKK